MPGLFGDFRLGGGLGGKPLKGPAVGPGAYGAAMKLVPPAPKPPPPAAGLAPRPPQHVYDNVLLRPMDADRTRDLDVSDGADDVAVGRPLHPLVAAERDKTFNEVTNAASVERPPGVVGHLGRALSGVAAPAVALLGRYLPGGRAAATPRPGVSPAMVAGGEWPAYRDQVVPRTQVARPAGGTYGDALERLYTAGGESHYDLVNPRGSGYYTAPGMARPTAAALRVQQTTIPMTDATRRHAAVGVMRDMFAGGKMVREPAPSSIGGAGSSPYVRLRRERPTSRQVSATGRQVIPDYQYPDSYRPTTGTVHMAPTALASNVTRDPATVAMLTAHEAAHGQTMPYGAWQTVSARPPAYETGPLEGVAMHQGEMARRAALARSWQTNALQAQQFGALGDSHSLASVLGRLAAAKAEGDVASELERPGDRDVRGFWDAIQNEAARGYDAEGYHDLLRPRPGRPSQAVPSFVRVLDAWRNAEEATAAGDARRAAPPGWPAPAVVPDVMNRVPAVRR